MRGGTELRDWSRIGWPLLLQGAPCSLLSCPWAGPLSWSPRLSSRSPSSALGCGLAQEPGWRQKSLTKASRALGHGGARCCPGREEGARGKGTYPGAPRCPPSAHRVHLASWGVPAALMAVGSQAGRGAGGGAGPRGCTQWPGTMAVKIGVSTRQAAFKRGPPPGGQGGAAS